MAGDKTLSKDVKDLTELLRVQKQQLAQQSQQLSQHSQQLAQLQDQGQQQTNQTRHIPLIPKLQNAGDLKTWRVMLIKTLDHYDLAKYIHEEVPEPRDPRSRRAWLIDRFDVDDYIQATVPDREVWNNLLRFGWSAKDLNPKKTFDLLVQYFERDALETALGLHHELITARCQAFDCLETFQARIIYLKDRLETTDFRMNEKAYTWLALKGIAHKYPRVYERCLPRIETLTWAGLMAEFRAGTVQDEWDISVLPNSSNSRKRKRGE